MTPCSFLLLAAQDLVVFYFFKKFIFNLKRCALSHTVVYSLPEKRGVRALTALSEVHRPIGLQQMAESLVLGLPHKP